MTTTHTHESLLRELVEDKRLYGRYVADEGEPGFAEAGGFLPAEGLSEANLADWLTRARALLGLPPHERQVGR